MFNPHVAALEVFEFSKKLAAVDPEEAREGFASALDIAKAAVVPDEALIARIEAVYETEYETPINAEDLDTCHECGGDANDEGCAPDCPEF